MRAMKCVGLSKILDEAAILTAKLRWIFIINHEYSPSAGFSKSTPSRKYSEFFALSISALTLEGFSLMIVCMLLSHDRMLKA
jgi:hypothetical protein